MTSPQKNSEVLIAIGRIDGKTDLILDQLRTQNKRIDAHDERLRTLENSRSKALGIMAFLMATGSWLAKPIMDLFR